MRTSRKTWSLGLKARGEQIKAAAMSRPAVQMIAWEGEGAARKMFAASDPRKMGLRRSAVAQRKRERATRSHASASSLASQRAFHDAMSRSSPWFARVPRARNDGRDDSERADVSITGAPVSIAAVCGAEPALAFASAAVAGDSTLVASSTSAQPPRTDEASETAKISADPTRAVRIAPGHSPGSARAHAPVALFRAFSSPAEEDRAREGEEPPRAAVRFVSVAYAAAALHPLPSDTAPGGTQAPSSSQTSPPMQSSIDRQIAIARAPRASVRRATAGGAVGGFQRLVVEAHGAFLQLAFAVLGAEVRADAVGVAGAFAWTNV